jgi:L-alanine-DL-glutamate epimerase-like enolase superfamily enzyme
LKGDPFAHYGLYISPESERDAIAKRAAARGVVGHDVGLLVETHWRLTSAEAMRVGKALEPYRPFFFEEPVSAENVDAMLKVAEAIDNPLTTSPRASATRR